MVGDASDAAVGKAGLGPSLEYDLTTRRRRIHTSVPWDVIFSARRSMASS